MVNRLYQRVKQNHLLIQVYVPSFLLSLAQGVLIPTLPLYAKSLGPAVSFGLVSIAVAATGIGTLVADLPSGILLERFGRRATMLSGATAVAVMYVVSGVVPLIYALIAFQFIGGIGAALWSISRHTYLTEVVPPSQRGQAISMFGGVGRIGLFGGPAIGGIIGSQLGLNWPFYVSGAMAAIATILAFLVMPDSEAQPNKIHARAYLATLGRVARDNGRVLTTAGFAQTLGQMVRAGRQIIVPLYGAYVIGLDVASIGTVISVSAAIDMTLFIPAGLLMDRLGRKYAVIPSFIILSVGMALIPLSTTYVALLLSTAVMGLGNGLGAGTMMTLGSDLAPRASIGSFLGIWRLIGDAGNAGGPLVVGAVADAIGVSAAGFVLAGVGGLAVILFLFVVAETRVDPEPAPT